MIKQIAMGVAKTVGAGRALGAAAKGRTGVLGTLAREHAEVAALLKAVKVERRRGKHLRDMKVMDRVRALQAIAFELLSHGIAEERHVYSALARVPEAAGLMREMQAEHAEFEQGLLELLSIPYSSPEWPHRLDALEQRVRHHVAREEGTLFGLLEEHLSEQELRDLDRRFRDEKAKQRKRLAGESFTLPRDRTEEARGML